MSSLFARKTIESLQIDATDGHGFKRVLGAMDLVLLGIGGIIGTGIFVLTGTAAAESAGPAVVLSFVIAGLASAFAGLCYAEMASMIPVAGSAYTYAYATLGELLAWVIGWDLVLEYLVGAATVSVGWSGYLNEFLRNILGIHLPPWLTASPYDCSVAGGCLVNLPAVVISLLVTGILIIGIKESARFNSIIVFVKVTVVLAFVAFTAKYVNPDNWHPFIPPNEGGHHFGWPGVFHGATTVFFAYIGFDAVSTAAQETRNPQRDLPIGILGSLFACTLLYVAVAGVLTGLVPFRELGVAHPIAKGVQATGIVWLEVAVEIGAIAGLSSVMVVLLMGQPRIFYSMSRDGLFFPFAKRIHPRFGTPHISTAINGVCCAVLGGFVPIRTLGHLTSVGTLFAFVLVSLGVMVLRRSRPELPRLFRVPGGTYLVPLLGAGSATYLIAQADAFTLARLFGWMALGLILYFSYGHRRSKLRSAGSA